jgi:hypothetical protein
VPQNKKSDWATPVQSPADIIEDADLICLTQPKLDGGKIGQDPYRRQGKIALFLLYLNTPYFSNTSFTTPFFRLRPITRTLWIDPNHTYISVDQKNGTTERLQWFRRKDYAVGLRM